MLDFPSPATTGQTFLNWVFDGTKWVNLTASALPFTDTGRNLVHNAQFNVAQRGAASQNGNGFLVDRWFVQVATSTVSVTQVVAVDADRAAIGDEAAQFYLQSVATGTSGAGDYVVPGVQVIENVRRLSGKTITVSFWARATAGTPRLGMEIYQSFGSGGSPSPTVTAIGSQAFTLSTTWTRFSASMAIPSIAGKTLGTNNDHGTAVRFWQSCGANTNAQGGGIGVQSYTLQLYGVQLEIGNVMTPLAKRDPADDIAACQRFYVYLRNQLFSIWTPGAGNFFMPSVTMPVTMRAAPSATLANVTANNGTLSFFQAVSTSYSVQAGNASSGQFVYGNYDITLSADL